MTEYLGNVDYLEMRCWSGKEDSPVKTQRLETVVLWTAASRRQMTKDYLIIYLLKAIPHSRVSRDSSDRKSPKFEISNYTTVLVVFLEINVVN